MACTPNEPKLLLEVAGCDEFEVFKGVRPTSPHVHSRVSVVDWTACCAFCSMAPDCVAWAHEADRPLGTINCYLMATDRPFAVMRRSEGQTMGRKREMKDALRSRQATYEIPPLRLSTWRAFEWKERDPISWDAALTQWKEAHFNAKYFDS